MSKKFLTEQLSQHVKLLQLKKSFGFFFSLLLTECLETKAPSPSLICLGRVPLGGGSAWTERALPEDYRMRGGEMGECACTFGCVFEVCALRVMGMGGGGLLVDGGWVGLPAIFSQNAAIVLHIEQSSAATLIFHSLSPL